MTKGKVIGAVTLLAILGITFSWGGGYARPAISGDQVSTVKGTTQTAISDNSSDEGNLTGKKIVSGADEHKDTETTDQNVKTTTKIEDRPGCLEGELTAEEKLNLAASLGDSSSGVEKGSLDYAKEKGMASDQETGKDKYLTEPVPEGKPVPV